MKPHSMKCRIWLFQVFYLVLCCHGQHVVHPEIVVPGEWQSGQNEEFLFLPLEIPDYLPLTNCKIMSNGDSILVVVTEQPKEEPDTKAMQKYKLILEAFKKEVDHDERSMKSKLNEWYETEDDEEVRVLIRAALDSLKEVRDLKVPDGPSTLTVPLGMLAKAPGQSALTEAGPMSFLAQAAKHTNSRLHRIIKESFSVEIPYPIATEKVFVIRTKDTELLVGMPLKLNSLSAQGISTGGKPFLRTPMFDSVGAWIGGPKSSPPLGTVAPSLDLQSVVAKGGLKVWQ